MARNSTLKWPTMTLKPFLDVCWIWPFSKMLIISLCEFFFSLFGICLWSILDPLSPSCISVSNLWFICLFCSLHRRSIVLSFCRSNSIESATSSFLSLFHIVSSTVRGGLPRGIFPFRFCYSPHVI